MRAFYRLLASVALVAVLSCGGKGTERFPCPPGGIGKATASGMDPAAQIENYKKFSCTQPQICPDQSPPYVPFYGIKAGEPPLAVNLGLSNCSTGRDKLVITKVAIRGDARCYFSEPQLESKEISPGEQVVLKSDYKPTIEGQDDAAFVIYSNAQNWPTLVVPFCSKGVPAGTILNRSEDGGVSPDGGANLQCREVKTVNTKCHQPE